MRAYIDAIRAKEGGGVEVVLIISRPLAPMKGDLNLPLTEEDERNFKAENMLFKENLHRFISLHLGRAELTQEAEEQ